MNENSESSNSDGCVPPRPAADAMFLPGESAAVPAYDALIAEVLTQLDQAPQQRTWLQSLLLLGFSLAMFAAAGFFNYSPTELAIVVAVLLFHELGHYVGMRLFNYQDVRMFFIPFLGAAVSGRRASVEGYKEAIVLLLGPLPGIVLGTMLGVYCLFIDSPLLRSAALMLLVVNGFNLLPFLPLDGGRLLHLIVFSRQRHLEAVFRVVTAALLALCGWLLASWILVVLGIFVLMATGYTFRVSTLAQRLRGSVTPGAELNLSAKIPQEWAVPIIERVRESFPQTNQAKSLANTVRQVWERMHAQPPGVAASIALMVIYGFSFLGAPAIAILFHLPVPIVVTRTTAEGAPFSVREVRSWGSVQEATELAPDGQFHGRHVEYFPTTRKVSVEGSYVDGEQDGTWTTYDEEGHVTSRAVYQRGQLIEG